MIGVQILINGQVIYARTAVNVTDKYYKNPPGKQEGDNLYDVDTGESIWHNPEDGAVVLAKKLLDTIHEQK